MKLDSDDFELFGLPRGFALERETLDGRWRALQAQVHPDRFVAQGAAAQRVAMQWAVRVNEAYRRLKDPLRRAAYLCELAGEPLQTETNTAMPADFLMQQMAWREALDDADGAAEVRALVDEVAAAQGRHFDAIARLLDVDRDAPAAAKEVRALMFIERFRHDLEDRLDALQA